MPFNRKFGQQTEEMVTELPSIAEGASVFSYLEALYGKSRFSMIMVTVKVVDIE